MNLISQAGQALATFAPTIATALGGPLAGLAVSKLESVFGIAPSATDKQSQIEASLAAATPDQILALQKAEDDFKVQMQTLKISEEQLVYNDIASARAREVAVKDRTPAILAGAVTLGFFSVLGVMLANGIPKAGGDALLVMLGALGAAWTSIVSYYYGSSSGSAAKTDTINKIASAK